LSHQTHIFWTLQTAPIGFTFVEWASNMTWKGISPIVHLVETTYEKGVKVLPEDLKQYYSSWLRSDTLPKWDITIVPN